MESLSYNQYIIKKGNKNLVIKFDLEETDYVIGENKKLWFSINKTTGSREF
jgi:hypothetical protein